MAAYLYGSIEITDTIAYAEYREKVPAVVAAFGGRFLVRGGALEVLEGEANPRRMVILEFPDMARLQAFYRSPEYQPLIALRQRASTGHLIAVEGV